jgi:dihydroxyacetone kinase
VATLQDHLRDVREDAARQAAARDVLQAELRAATDAQRRSEEARHHAEQRAVAECSSLHAQVTKCHLPRLCIV